MAYLFAQLGEVKRGLKWQITFVGNDLSLFIPRRVGELDRDKALPRRVFEVFEDTLVAGVVRDNQQKILMRLKDFGPLINRQNTPVVGQRMDKDDGVLARFHDLVQITNRPGADGLGQRPVHPDGIIAFNKIPTDQVAPRQVFMAGDRDDIFRDVLTAVRHEHMSHMLDKAGLAAAGRAFQQNRQTTLIGGPKNIDLIAYG